VIVPNSSGVVLKELRWRIFIAGIFLKGRRIVPVHKAPCTGLHLFFMAANNPCVRKFVQRIQDKQDRKKANQTFQLHILGFTFFTLWQRIALLQGLLDFLKAAKIS